MTTLQQAAYLAATDSEFRQQLLAGERERMLPFLMPEEQEALLWVVSLHPKDLKRLANNEDEFLLWVPGKTE